MKILIVKILEIFCNILLMYNIAIYLGEEFYFLIGILNLYNMFLILVSNIGIESIIIRNYLFWKNNNQLKEILYFEELAFFSKKVLGLICSVILLFLSLYYSFIKYESSFLEMFIIFIFSANITSIINTYDLLLISRNEYKKIYYSRFILFTIVKLIIVFINLKYNFFSQKNFLILYSLVPLLRYLYLKYTFKKILINNSKINLKILFKEIKNLKAYIVENYSRFFSNMGDQLILSLLFSKEFFSTYSLIKNLENTGLVLIETIFDPLIQNEVSNKNNISLLNQNYKKINKEKNLLVGLSILIIIFYYFHIDTIIKLLKFEKYVYFKEMSLGLSLCLLLYLMLKVKLNYISLFFMPKYRIFYSSFWLIIIPVYFFVSQENIILLRVLYYFLYFIIINIIFMKSGGKLNEKNIYYDV